MNKIKIKGKNKKGKKILIISGVHGNELTPIYCSYLLSKQNFDKKKFKRITIVSAINDNGVAKNTRDIPNMSTSDLNRMFNIKEDISEKGDSYFKGYNKD
jgi:predicted deacylase